MLTGTGFVTGATTVVVSGGGASVNSVAVTSSTSLTANIAIDPGAEPGPRGVSVTTAGGSSGSEPFAIVAPTLVSLAVSCDSAKLQYRYTTSQCTATAVYSNGNSVPLTTGVVWQSSDPRNAPVSSNGVVTTNAFSPTNVSISATFQNVSASFTMHLSGCGVIVPNCYS
jgi:hypothetical protein